MAYKFKRNRRSAGGGLPPPECAGCFIFLAALSISVRAVRLTKQEDKISCKVCRFIYTAEIEDEKENNDGCESDS